MKKLFLILCSATVAGLVMAGGGTVTQSVTSNMGTVKRARIAWTSVTNDATGTIGYFNGEILRVSFVSASGSSPTITMTDPSGRDILSGLGAGVSSNSITTVVPKIETVAVGGTVTNESPMVVDGALSVIVTNCSVGSGYVDIYYYGAR